jgi:membrane protein implicated in regulation of membrane protease activity
MRDLVLPVLAVIVAVLAFLWWRPMQRWALGIDELERRIEALERKTMIDLPRSSGFIPL